MPRRRNALGMLSDTLCVIPACDDYPLKGHHVCMRHSVEIWQTVQRSKGDPEVHQIAVELVADRERRAEEAHRKNIEFNKQHGTIYYLRLDEKIKIGWSANLPQRLMSYPPHMVLLCDHPGTRADERDLHRSFKPSRAAGREWYHPTQELLAHIDRSHRAEIERRNSAHWERVERDYGTEHMLRVKAYSERSRG